LCDGPDSPHRGSGADIHRSQECRFILPVRRQSDEKAGRLSGATPLAPIDVTYGAGRWEVPEPVGSRRMQKHQPSARGWLWLSHTVSEASLSLTDHLARTAWVRTPGPVRKAGPHEAGNGL